MNESIPRRQWAVKKAKLSRFGSMVLGSQISVPPIGVLLAVVSTAIGNFLLTGHGLSSGAGGGGGGGGDLAIPVWTAWPTFAWHWFSAWLLGSLILGFVLAVMVFWLTLLLGSWRSSRAVGAPAKSTADQFTQP